MPVRSAISASGSTAADRQLLAFCRHIARHENAEHGSLVESAVAVDVRAGLLDDSVDGRQAKAGALADFLGGEERFEYLGLHLRRHAGAGILEIDQHIIDRRQRLVSERRDFTRRQIARAHRHRAAARHGVARVDGEIDDDRLELVEIGFDRPEIATVNELQLDVLAKEPSQKDRQVGEHLAQRKDLRPERLTARERQQLPHQAGGAVGVLLDVHDVLEGRVARPVIGEKQIGETDDRRQHIVEVVCDAAGELADRVHLLALRELLLEGALFGRLERIDDDRFLVPGAVLDGIEVEAGAAVLVAGKRSHRSAGSCRHRRPPAASAASIGGPDRRRARPDSARCRPAARPDVRTEHLDEGDVGPADPAVPIDGGDGDRGIVEEARKADLGGAQRFGRNSSPGLRLSTRVRVAPGAPSAATRNAMVKPDRAGSGRSV